MNIIKFVKAFKKHKIPYAIVGGHAVALHGAVRGTIDIDFITKLTLKNLKLIELALNELGLVSRLPINATELYHFKDEYIKNKNLIAWNFTNPQNSAEQVGIIITFDLKNKAVKKLKIHNEVINILSKRDLIEMKKFSGRKQDLIDIEALEKINEKR